MACHFRVGDLCGVPPPDTRVVFDRGMLVASSALTNIDPWGRSLGETLRRWWWVPAAFALVGAVLGGLIGSGSPSSVPALLRVQSTASNGDGLNQAAQSALTEMGTSEVFGRAASELGIAERDLRARTKLTTVPESLILQVEVSAPSPEEAVRDANAVAAAGVAASSERVANEMSSLTASTAEVIRTQRLADQNAEAQRVARLGAALAENQSQTLAQSRQLTVLQAAALEAATSTSRVMLILLGGVGAGLVGVALALFFGGRRGRMSKLGEMRRLYPDLEFIPARDVPAVLSMEMPTPQRVVITGVRAPVAAIRSLIDPVAEGFKAAGRDVVVTQNVAKYGASQSAPAVKGAPATVLETGLSTAIVKRVARDPEALLLVLVRPHKTRFEWLDEHSGQFGDRTYIVVDS